MAEASRENLHKFLSFREISGEESRRNLNAVLDQLTAVEYAENYITGHAVCCFLFILA
jgi:hypothetical protein